MPPRPHRGGPAPARDPRPRDGHPGDPRPDPDLPDPRRGGGRRRSGAGERPRDGGGQARAVLRARRLVRAGHDPRLLDLGHRRLAVHRRARGAGPLPRRPPGQPAPPRAGGGIVWRALDRSGGGGAGTRPLRGGRPGTGDRESRGRGLRAQPPARRPAVGSLPPRRRGRREPGRSRQDGGRGPGPPLVVPRPFATIASTRRGAWPITPPATAASTAASPPIRPPPRSGRPRAPPASSPPGMAAPIPPRRPSAAAGATRASRR